MAKERLVIPVLGLAACLAVVGPAFSANESAGTANTSQAERDRGREKALLLLELARYVEWPASSPPAGAEAAFVIGVLGDDPSRRVLRDELAGKKLHGRPVEVRLFANLDEVEPCPVLLVGNDKARLLPVILDFLDGASVLTVGDRDDFVETGGVVRLIEQPDRIAFEVNLAAAERRGLRLSAPLLQHAQRVLTTAEDSSQP